MNKLQACEKWVSTFGFVPVSAAEKLRVYSFLNGSEDFEEETIFTENDDPEPDSHFPAWSNMWCFSETADERWFDSEQGIKILSECGFRVYRSEDFGLVFGIDGAGYNFYEYHWLPLYEKRGLQWHDKE